MEYIEKIKKMLCRELEEYGEKNRISAADLETIWKLTDVVKNLNKIEMLEESIDGEYSQRRGGYSRTMSYDDDMSYADRRGRGSNARRDNMGRYASDGSSYDDYSENSYARRGYSRGDAKDHMMSKLGEMMEEADPNEREILKQAMRKIEKA